MQRTVLTFLFWAALNSVGFAQQNVDTNKCETTYRQWHQEITSPRWRIRSETTWWFDLFQANTLAATNLARIICWMDSNKVEMAYYMCAKIANDTNLNVAGLSNEDARLLEYVSGIDLYRQKRASTSGWLGFFSTPPTNRENLVAQFRRDWNAGVFRDPSQRIKDLCRAMQDKESSNILDPDDLLAFRRYGIFGLPEIMRQVRKNDSRHAFAAYLIITGNDVQYSEYIKNADREYLTSKGEHMYSQFKLILSENRSDFEICKQIAAAISVSE